MVVIIYNQVSHFYWDIYKTYDEALESFAKRSFYIDKNVMVYENIKIEHIFEIKSELNIEEFQEKLKPLKEERRKELLDTIQNKRDYVI